MTACRRRTSTPGFEESDSPGDAWTCDEGANVMRCAKDSLGTAGGAADEDTAVTGVDTVIGYPQSDIMTAKGEWCQVSPPPMGWTLKRCGAPGWGTHVKMLTYNLFWWNLFDKRGGAGRSAGKLIAQTAGAEGYDLMAFQECDDRNRVLRDAQAEGLQGDWEAVDGGHAIALMYRKDRFTVLAEGNVDVGEDSRKQYYGKRDVIYARLRHKDGPVVFFINHHGPLPVSEDGDCTGVSAAYNILKVIANNAHKGDAIILTGDFNAALTSSRIRELDKYLHRVFSGRIFGGVDHIFSNCEQTAQKLNLGKGHGDFGSDHDALSVTFTLR